MNVLSLGWGELRSVLAALYARRLRSEFLETTTAVFQVEMNRGHVARVVAAVEQEALVRVTRLGLVAAMADVRTLLPSTLRYAYGRRRRRDKGRLVSDSWKSARLLSSTCLTPSACSSATRASPLCANDR